MLTTQQIVMFCKVGLASDRKQICLSGLIALLIIRAKEYAMATSTALLDQSLPQTRILHVGITGHRQGNRAFDDNRAEIAACLTRMFGELAQTDSSGTDVTTTSLRIITCLAHGADLLAAEVAQAGNWPVQAPLPFSKSINLAMNTPDLSLSQIADAFGGKLPTDPAALSNWHRLAQATEYAQCFELAEQDDALLTALSKAIEPEADEKNRQELDTLLAERSHAASMITIEQSDIVIAIWDGLSANALGGTRDTINQALSCEVPVIWINAYNPDHIRLLCDPADLLGDPLVGARQDFDDIVQTITHDARMRWSAEDEATTQLSEGTWRSKSARRFHMYRRVESVFGGGGKRFSSLRQTYEHPQSIAAGSYQPLMQTLRGLPNADTEIVDRIGQYILPRFAFADGVSTYLSDAYRGGMVASFLMSAGAIIAGVAYLPVFGAAFKWPFALVEFFLLISIIAVTVAGTRGNWHRRWFRTRRVAEYLRHAPIMITLGCARPIGRWPKSRDQSWPEDCAKIHILSVGLPEMTVTGDYLQAHLNQVIRPFLDDQSAYHRAKSLRLEKVHHNLDRVSEALFILAVISVGAYLLFELLSVLSVLDPAIPASVSKSFTFAGVVFPTLGAALASIRYFGDFERFAAISDVTAAKLERLKVRAANLAAGYKGSVVYRDYADLAHAMNDIVIEEIESWQSIFGTKKMSIPV